MNSWELPFREIDGSSFLYFRKGRARPFRLWSRAAERPAPATWCPAT